jgi:hypothetical protein
LRLIGESAREQEKLTAMRQIDLAARRQAGELPVDEDGQVLPGAIDAMNRILSQAEAQKKAVRGLIEDRQRAERDWLTGAKNAFNEYVDDADERRAAGARPFHQRLPLDGRRDLQVREDRQARLPLVRRVGDRRHHPHPNPHGHRQGGRRQRIERALAVRWRRRGDFPRDFQGGTFALGGRPPLGKVSLVGERGPELFVPDTAGTIFPNGKLRRRRERDPERRHHRPRRRGQHGRGAPGARVSQRQTVAMVEDIGAADDDLVPRIAAGHAIAGQHHASARARRSGSRSRPSRCRSRCTSTRASSGPSDVALPPMVRADAENWIAFLLSLRGVYGTFLHGRPGRHEPARHVGRLAAVNGAHAARVRTVAVDGFSVGATGKAGDWMQFGSPLDLAAAQGAAGLHRQRIRAGQYRDMAGAARRAPRITRPSSPPSRKACGASASNERSWDVGRAL